LLEHDSCLFCKKKGSKSIGIIRKLKYLNHKNI
jgi:hypothetical protein